MWNPYNQYQPMQAAPMQQYPQRAVPGQGYSIIKVNGRNGAEMFQMPPNSQALLLDETMPIVWLAQTDGAGYKSLSPYKIEPYQPETPVDTKSLEARLARVEEWINGQSNTGNVGKTGQYVGHIGSDSNQAPAATPAVSES